MQQRLVLAAVWFATALAAIPEHRMTALPGWNGTLPSAHYSGYLPVGNGSGFLHCVLWPIGETHKH